MKRPIQLMALYCSTLFWLTYTLILFQDTLLAGLKVFLADIVVFGWLTTTLVNQIRRLNT